MGLLLLALPRGVERHHRARTVKRKGLGDEIVLPATPETMRPSSSPVRNRLAHESGHHGACLTKRGIHPVLALALLFLAVKRVDEGDPAHVEEVALIPREVRAAKA